VKPKYTQIVFHFSIKEANELIKAGKVETVTQEFDRYISATSTNSRISSAAFHLLRGLQELKTKDIEHAPPEGHGEAPRPLSFDEKSH